MTLVAVAAAALVAGFIVGRVSAAKRYRRRVSQLSQWHNRREDGLCAVIENLRRESGDAERARFLGGPRNDRVREAHEVARG
jgi:hypothetical protein